MATFAVILCVAFLIVICTTWNKSKILKLITHNIKIIHVGLVSIIYILFCIIYTPSVRYGFRYILCIYPLLCLALYLGIIFLVKAIVKDNLHKVTVVILSMLFIIMAFTSGILENFQNIDYLHQDNSDTVKVIQEYDIKNSLFINKSDSQEYVFWLQYNNLLQNGNSNFLLTTVERINEIPDSELNTIIKGNCNNLLVYIISGYNREETDKIVNQMADRVGFRDVKYINTLNSERIYYCSY